MYIQNHTGWGLFKIIHARYDILSPIVGNSKNRLLLAVLVMVVAGRTLLLVCTSEYAELLTSNNIGGDKI